MTRLFVPYIENSPLTMDIKGRRFVIVAPSPKEILPRLRSLAGGEIREISVSEHDCAALTKLAESINGGVVVTPAGISIDTTAKNLERELPWLH